MAYVTRGDAEIWYETAGEGAPLLLIAGTASDVASWMPLVPLLSGRHRLIMFDNRGAGRTRFAGEISHDAIVDDIIALLDHLNIDSCDVLGHSLGGMLAFRLAQKAPQRVNRIVAATCTAGREPKADMLFESLAEIYDKDGPEIFFRHLFQWLFAPPFFSDPARVDEAISMATAYPYRQSSADLRRQLAAMADADPVMVSAVSHRTLVLAAEDDLLTTPKMVRAAFADLPEKREVVIADAGHSVHWDKPVETATAVLNFLAEGR